MPGASLLALIDDIATILDDVAVMTKVATKKASGVLGDDLALNAEQVAGVNADRELPVIWAVAKGSFINKAILVPLALLLSYYLPILIIPLLMIGGLFLCYEGAEKVNEKLFHKKNSETPKVTKIISEKEKIKGAVRTDFILSAEVIIIAMSITSKANFNIQIITLSLVGILMTVGVYGIVALIVKIDDFGLFLLKKQNSLFKKTGESLLKFAPLLMKFLGIIGTIAMFSVGGGILLEETLHLTFSQLIQLGLNKNEILMWIFKNAKFIYAISFGIICGNLVILFKTSFKKYLLNKKIEN